MSAAAVIAIASTSEWEGRAEFPPGPQLACALAGQRPGELADVELIEVMAAAGRLACWAQALQLAAVDELSRRRHHGEHGPGAAGYWASEINEIVTEEVSLALTLTGTAAARMVVLAEQLTEQLPLTWAALLAGRIDLFRVQVIADAVRGLDDGIAATVEAAVLEKAAMLTTGKLRHRVKEAVKAADPDAAEQRKRAAVRDRRLEIYDTPAGTSDLALRDLPAEQAHAAWNKINAAAQAMKADGDPRPIDAIRADLAHALLRGVPLPDAVREPVTGPEDGTGPRSEDPVDAASHGGPAACHAGTRALQPGADGDAGRHAEIIAAVERQIADALTRDTDHRLNGLLEQARRTGRLDGLAQLIAQSIQAMHDAFGEVRDSWCEQTGGTPGRHGHDGYRPPAAMRRLILERHATCVFPTCNRRATGCDLDHTTAWHRGGRTCRCNLAPLCRRHHRLKQHRSWKLLQPWPGLLVWVTPSGTWHIVTPQ